MKKIIAFTFLCVAFSFRTCFGATSASFYVIAHQDQWQLFMGINAYNDMIDNTGKVIMIYLTAGDASCGGPLNTPYYLSREEGADNCVEFCADKQPGGHTSWSSSYHTVAGHSVLRRVYKTVVSYYLRLPDGCGGVGLFGQSLQYLHDHPVTDINAVDASAVYHGYSDLVNTVRQIIIQESTGISASNIWLNTADTDPAHNPGDHPDHIYAAQVGLDAISSLLYIKEVLFEEYNTAGKLTNLNNEDIATEAALLSVLDYARTSVGQPSEWSSWEVDFTSRNYFREVRRPIRFNPFITLVNYVMHAFKK